MPSSSCRLTCSHRMPFAFLSELQKRFLASYSADDIEDAPAHGMSGFSSTISQLMVRAPAIPSERWANYVE